MSREKALGTFTQGKVTATYMHARIGTARIMRDDLVALMFFVHVAENSTPDACISQLPKHTDLLPLYNVAKMMPSSQYDVHSVNLGHMAISQ